MGTGLAILSALLFAVFLWGRFWPLLLTPAEVERIAARPLHCVLLAGDARWSRAGWLRRLDCLLFGRHYRVGHSEFVFWMATTGRTEMLVAAWERR